MTDDTARKILSLSIRKGFYDGTMPATAAERIIEAEKLLVLAREAGYLPVLKIMS